MARLRLAELLERQGSLSEAAPHWSAVTQLAANIPNAPPLAVDALARGRAFLTRHNEAFAAALDLELGSLSSSGEERRMRACVDAMLGQRQIFRNKSPGSTSPSCRPTNSSTARCLPWLAEVEARTHAIRREALALVS
ncbi:hypothetical protein AB5I41_23185 [Sphingomonas sp. MMS24-JH45]